MKNSKDNSIEIKTAHPIRLFKTEKPQKYKIENMTIEQKEEKINQPHEKFEELRKKRIEAMLEKHKRLDLSEFDSFTDNDLKRLAFTADYFPFEQKTQATEAEIEEMTTIVKMALRETLLPKQTIPQNNEEKQPETKDVTDFFFGK